MTARVPFLLATGVAGFWLAGASAAEGVGPDPWRVLLSRTGQATPAWSQPASLAPLQSSLRQTWSDVTARAVEQVAPPVRPVRR